MKDGGPAFSGTSTRLIETRDGYGRPIEAVEESYHVGGMSLRDYFAAAALQGLLVAQSKLPGDDEDSVSWGLACGVGAEINCLRQDGSKFTWGAMLADNAYAIADAMLEERESGK